MEIDSVSSLPSLLRLEARRHQAFPLGSRRTSRRTRPVTIDPLKIKELSAPGAVPTGSTARKRIQEIW